MTGAPARPRIPEKTAPSPVTEQLEEKDVVVTEAPKEEVAAEKIELIPGLQGNDFKEGQIIRVNTIYFKADSTSFTNESFDALVKIMKPFAVNAGCGQKRIGLFADDR